PRELPIGVHRLDTAQRGCITRHSPRSVAAPVPFSAGARNPRLLPDPPVAWFPTAWLPPASDHSQPESPQRLRLRACARTPAIGGSLSSGLGRARKGSSRRTCTRTILQRQGSAAHSLPSGSRASAPAIAPSPTG